MSTKTIALKIYKVQIMGNDYFAYGKTQQGAINVVFDAIKGSGVAELAQGKEIFEYGQDGGLIFGDSFAEEKVVQEVIDLNLPEVEVAYEDDAQKIPEAVAC